MTPWTENGNPGYSTFTYNSNSQTLEDLTFTFLQLDSTFSLPSNATIDQMQFFVVDFDIDFGLHVISGEEISKFSDRLAADPILAQQFLANRIGYAQTEKT